MHTLPLRSGHVTFLSFSSLYVDLILPPKLCSLIWGINWESKIESVSKHNEIIQCDGIQVYQKPKKMVNTHDCVYTPDRVAKRCSPMNVTGLSWTLFNLAAVAQSFPNLIAYVRIANGSSVCHPNNISNQDIRQSYWNTLQHDEKFVKQDLLNLPMQ